MSSIDWWIVGVGFCACFVMVPLVRADSLRRGLIDYPGPRRSHSRPVARGGGIAITIAMLGCIALVPGGTLEHAVLAAAVAGFSLLGWLDDHQPLPVLVRLLPELAFGGLLLGLIWPPEWGVLAWAATLVIVVWWVNLFNFMDGSDGLATAQACFMAAALGYALLRSEAADWATLALALAAASAAFFYWNRPPAKIFLGDAGSLMLGGSLALLYLNALIEEFVTAAFCLILAAPFLVDASLTLARRLARKQQWYTAHREHAYQILIQSGWSHHRVLTGLLLIDFFLVAPVALLALARPELEAVLAAMILIVLTGVWSIVQFRLAGGRVTE